MSATVIPIDQIRARAGSEMREFLSNVPGLNSYDLSGSVNQGVVESRGFTSFGETSYIQVLIDGFPVADLEKDAVDWSFLAPGQVERIEVLRGPVSYLYGSSAMGGVVNLVTRRPQPGLGFWAEGGAGGNGEYATTAGGTRLDGRTAASVSISRRMRDGFRDHSAGALTNGHFSFDALLSTRWSLRSRLLLQHARREIPGPLPDSLAEERPGEVWAPFRNDHRRQDVVQPSVELSRRISPSLDLVGLVQFDSRKTDAIETVYPVGSLDRSTKSRAVSTEARLTWKSATTHLDRAMVGGTIGGGNLESRYFSSGGAAGGIVGAGDVGRTDASLFGWVRFAVDSVLTVNGGLRWDWSRSSKETPIDPNAPGLSQETAALSPAVGINYEIPNHGNVYMSVSRSFKNPTLEQLYDTRPYDLDGPGDLPPQTISSSGLDPQRGVHLDLGTRLELGKSGRVEADVYYAKSTDEIGFDLAGFTYGNIEESTHYGFEGGLTVDLHPMLSGQTVYTFTRARFDGGPNDGNQINVVPKHAVHCLFDFRPRHWSRITLDIHHVRDQWIDEGNRYVISPYTVLNAAVDGRIRTIGLFCQIENLMDERYAPAGYQTIDESGAEIPLYFPAAGRNYRFGIRLGLHESN